MSGSLNGKTETRRKLRVLIVEDSEIDALLMERGGFAPKYERVEKCQAMDEALEKHTWDVILADHSMPQFSAPEALERVTRRGLDIPFIIVSGHIDEETAIKAMRAGAHDYVMKDRLARLVPVIERELREAEMRKGRRQYEEDLRQAHEELGMRVEQRTAALKAANRKLENVIEERKRLENELLEIAENERRSIGFDLHDDLGQKLTGLSLMMKGLEQKLLTERHPSAEDAGKIHELISELIQHTHNLAHQFSSLDVEGDDLAVVLRGLAGNVKKMFPVECELVMKGSVPELPQHTTIQFYKIAQEAVSNAIKHGKATHVAIHLVKNGDKLFLAIQNDGLPFSVPAGKKNRMGLRIMNYRASTVDATLEVRPGEKGGTVVTCALPCKNAVKPRRRGDVHAEKPMVGVEEELHREPAGAHAKL
jgi:signal transduction histidine kinase